MRKTFKSQSGVSLLEIMLVLAIAALIIVMSIRFYQSAADSNKVNAGLNTIQAVVAAAESSITAIGNTSNTANYLPGGVLPNSPWGGAVTMVDSGASLTYTIKMPVPGGDATKPCEKLEAFLETNTKFAATCSGTSISVVVTP